MNQYMAAVVDRLCLGSSYGLTCSDKVFRQNLRNLFCFAWNEKIIINLAGR